jgi:all-trans-retinol 13,14-reductase
LSDVDAILALSRPKKQTAKTQKKITMRLAFLVVLYCTVVSTSTLFAVATAFLRKPVLQRTPGTRSTTTTITTSLTSQKTKARPVDSVVYKSSMQLDKQEFDTIVIGSGIGGLAAAALLAQSKDHHKVLVLEQHYQCGGCCHTFEKNGYKFGTGIHYVGEVGNKDTSRTSLNMKVLLDAVTPLHDSIPWTPMAANYDTIILGRHSETSRCYHIYAKENQQRLKEQFPNDEDAIDRYFELCQKAQKSVERGVGFKMMPRSLVKALRWTGLMRLVDGGFHKYSKITLRQVVESVTDNPDLQAVLCYNWGDYGSVPSETPFLMHATLVAHYQDGAYYPTGGPDVIPKKIIPVITANGGKVLSNAPVRRILMDDQGRKAVGVELADRTQVRAKHAVISDAGLINTCRSLLPPKQRDAIMERCMVQTNKNADTTDTSRLLHSSPTALNLFVGLKGDHFKDLHLPPYQLWMYPSALIEEDLENLPSTLEEGLTRVKPQDLTPVFVGAPSGKDGDWSKNHPGKSTLEIITYAHWEWFEKFAPPKLADADGALDPGGKPGSHGKEYKQAKEKLAETIWARVRQGLVDSGASDSLPKTLANVDTYELGTPLAYAHYLRADTGAVYGLNHDVNRFSPRIFFQELRPDVPEIPGLYLTGQDVSTCGLVGALVGAYLCASKVLGVRNPFSLLKEVENNRVISTTTTTNKDSLVLGIDAVEAGVGLGI